jgi:hypothetical protein
MQRLIQVISNETGIIRSNVFLISLKTQSITTNIPHWTVMYNRCHTPCDEL